MKVCNNCGVELTNDNWHPSLEKKNSKICKSCHLKNGQLWRKRNPKKGYEYTKVWLAKRPNYQRDNYRKYRGRIRREMTTAYGGVCKKCGIDDMEVLDVDHINNRGGIDRKNGLWGWKLYGQLRKLGYPKENYQLLCRNCNWKKHLHSKE